MSHNVSFTCSWILRDDVWPDTFRLWCYSLSLVACRCLSVIPVPLLSFSDIPTMLILIAAKSMQDQACIFLCICFRNLPIHQPKVVYHSVQSPRFFILKSPRLFCIFVNSICDISHSRIPPKYFLVFQWCFI